MPVKKAPVTTPLHLLQQLSRSLIEHLEKACEQASKDAYALLEKLEKQRGKTQEKLAKARSRLDEAESSGKPKTQDKARARLAELEELSSLLQVRHNETVDYIAELKRDTAQSLELAKGIIQVEEAAAKARSKPALETARTSGARTSARKKTTASEAESPTKPAQTRQTAKTPPAKKTVAATRPASSRAKPAVASGAPAKAPRARKPASK